MKIADIVFAFNNAELIKLLKERGQHIMFQRFDQMREVEAKISKLKDENYQDLTRPVCAFITFEEEDAYLLALDFAHDHEEDHGHDHEHEKPKLKPILGHEFKCVAATEPTNIIWENRHLTGT